jgi:uncharacterized membrane protein YraQ (UPF0718 family)
VEPTTVDAGALVAGQPSRRAVAASVLGTAAFVAIFAAALDWAKWTPYAHKLTTIWSARTWPGSNILDKAGPAGSSPSPHGAWTFTTAYVNAIWMAIVAGLLIAAAVEALVPRRWLLRTLARRTQTGGSLAGALCALPSLMCTCCTAPVAATLRRNGVPTSAALSYWLGNPVLNPAVLAFLALVAPWQWVTTRIAIGLLLVLVGMPIVARMTGAPATTAPVDWDAGPAFRLADAPRRYVLALARLAVTLLPEYFVVVLLLGLVRGWLFPLDGGSAHWTVLAVLAACVLGTLVVIPTGGEIPIAQGLAAAGVSAGAVGALLITLPAISLVSMAMVVRAFSLRVTVAAACAVAFAGLLAGALLAALA